MKTLVRTNRTVFSGIPSFIDNIFESSWGPWFQHKEQQNNPVIPAVNIHEDDETFSVELAVPGIKKEDFKIEIKGDTLKIFSEVKNAKEDKQMGNVHRKEFSYYSFERSFVLPANVDKDQISAKYDYGILHINAPKKETFKKQNAKKIEIR